MDLNRTLTRRDDLELPCGFCGSETVHKRYDNGRHELFLCSVCATLTTSTGRGLAKPVTES